MRHHKSKRVFGREKDQRNALIRSLAYSLILKNSIKTTEAKAKELRPFVERLITKSKDGTLASRRLVLARVGDEKVTKKLFETIAPKYAERKGGYTRITKLGTRANDAAAMAQIEFV